MDNISFGGRILILFASISILLILALQPIGKIAYANIGEQFRVATAVFVTAKALNGVISVAQGTEVGPPGVNFSVGEILDPLNDLVEQFSWVMLAALVSLGIQEILLHISGWLPFNVAIAVLIVGANIALWLPYAGAKTILKLALMLLFLRFFVPLTVVASDYSYHQFLEQTQYNVTKASRNLERVSENIESINEQKLSSNITKEQTLLQKISKALKFDFNPKQIWKRYKEEARSASEHIVNLLVSFIFQTILFPILFLATLVAFLKEVFYKR